MQYPLPEKIGEPTLLVGRKKEFAKFQKWLDRIPRALSKSRAVIARRKSGKTVFVQRIFNQLWSEQGTVIPFYLDIPEKKAWYPNFAFDYYRAFASQYISFFERDEKLVRDFLTLEQIRDYGTQTSDDFFVRDVDVLWKYKEKGLYDTVWQTAHTAPHRLASVRNQRILVILDEFQNITQYIYRNEACEGSPDESMAGSFHSLAESKIAPMLVTGSYVGWLLTIIHKYLEAGRLSLIRMSPYLAPDEGLEAVYRYAEVYGEPITNQTAILLNELCMSDPFFIASVILNEYEEKDLTIAEGVINAVHYEVTDRDSEMSKTWREYIDITLPRVNENYAKQMLLWLSKRNDRYWTPHELKEKLNIDLSESEIHRKLMTLYESDLIDWGSSDLQFRGLQDGTLNLILRNRYEEEILGFVPDLKQEFQVQIKELQKKNRSLRGLVSHLEGILAENLLAGEFRSKKRFRLSDYFLGVQDDRELNILNVQERTLFQCKDGKKSDIDVLATAKDGCVVMVEVKKHQERIGKKIVEDFFDKVNAYAEQFNVVVLPAFLSHGGFTKSATTFCCEYGIGMAEEIRFFEFEPSGDESV